MQKENEMQNFFKISTVAAAMLLSGLTVSYAQQADQPMSPAPGDEQMDGPDGMGGGHHRGGRHGEGRGGRHGMPVIDINMDGVIGDEEAAMLADHAFSRMDQDRNDALSEAEFTTPPQGGHRGWFSWGQEEVAAVTDVRKTKFVVLDADKNGAVSRAEFFADAKAKLAAADADKDGKVTPWEFRAMSKI
jgi:EF hand